jgi:uncharacterized cupredoxin-like copper-binding protein
MDLPWLFCVPHKTAGEVEIRANVPGLKSAGMVLVTK